MASRRKPQAFRCCCLQVCIVERMITWAWQPAAVRLPPKTLRLTIGVRNACGLLPKKWSRCYEGL